MNKEFVNLVNALRFAQRLDDERKTSNSLEQRKKMEIKVDEWMLRYKRDQEQLEMWSRSVISSEIPGEYNTVDEIETEEGGAA